MKDEVNVEIRSYTLQHIDAFIRLDEEATQWRLQEFMGGRRGRKKGYIQFVEETR